jgi:NitT/TauT family transport system ATP-binding protein
MNAMQMVKPAVPVIQASRVYKQFGNGAVTALRDVSIELRENEFTAFVGPSGCGKTTMLRIIAGLEHPTRGRVTMNGTTVTGPGPERGMLFQAYTSFPWLTARKNVEYGM